jgi:Na+-translocating ferredoxin:NAD+ oxidoreductase RnfC subunit
MKRLNVTYYDVPTPYTKNSPQPDHVKIMMKQHAGTAARSIVKTGDFVNENDRIAEIDENVLGANIHASIGGKVTEVTNEFIRIEK